MDFEWLMSQRARCTAQVELCQVGLEEEERLRLRVAKSHVVLQDFRTVDGEHDSCEEHSSKWSA